MSAAKTLAIVLSPARAGSAGGRIAAGLDLPQGLKGSIPVAQTHRDVVGIHVGNGQVLRPVPIEVPHRNGPPPPTPLSKSRRDERYILRMSRRGDQHTRHHQPFANQRRPLVLGCHCSSLYFPPCTMRRKSRHHVSRLSFEWLQTAQPGPLRPRVPQRLERESRPAVDMVGRAYCRARLPCGTVPAACQERAEHRFAGEAGL